MLAAVDPPEPPAGTNLVAYVKDEEGNLQPYEEGTTVPLGEEIYYKCQEGFVFESFQLESFSVTALYDGSWTILDAEGKNCVDPHGTRCLSRCVCRCYRVGQKHS